MGNSTIFDDVLRTIQERRPKLLIPLVNEVFHTAYPENMKVTRLPEEYQKVVSKVVADSPKPKRPPATYCQRPEACRRTGARDCKGN